jgi:hypothetical protein
MEPKLRPPGVEEAEAAAAPDPFDLDNLRVDQSFIESCGVKKLLTTIPVRKPSPQDFVRVNSDPAFQESLALIELREDREYYLVPKVTAPDLVGETIGDGKSNTLRGRRYHRRASSSRFEPDRGS